MSIANNISTVSERHIYGSSRLGMDTTRIELLAYDPPSANHVYTTNADARIYELTNHLGNVIATFTARKLPVADNDEVTGFMAHVTSLSDYYPFGSALTGRMVDDNYRYGFNGMEREGEIHNPGSAYDFGARVYDGRLGRWWSVDPLASMYPGASDYIYAFNSPLVFNDKDGENGRITVVDEDNKHTVTLETTVYLVGKDAEMVANKPKFTSQIVKVQDAEIQDKVWEVQIKVTYVYSEEVNQTLSDNGMADGQHLDQVGLNTPQTSRLLSPLGFVDGDNLMQVDNSLPPRMGSEAGGTGQGAFVGYVRTNRSVADIINHEVGHQLGFDERYGLGKVFHDGWAGDYQGASIPMAAERQFNAKHYVELLDFALQTVTPNSTMTYNPFHPSGTLRIDDTDGGQQPYSSEENQSLENRVVN